MHEIEPVVAQTELPPIPDDLKAVYAVVNVQHMDEDWFCNYSFVRGLIERIASLTQRLQASEAREAELKAEIERLKIQAAEQSKAASQLADSVIRHNNGL